MKRYQLNEAVKTAKQ